MKGGLKRPSAEVSPQLAEGSKRRKRSRSAEPQPPAAGRPGSDGAQAATDGAAEAAARDGSPKGELAELFRKEDVAQLASEFPLEAFAAVAHRTRSASAQGDGGATPQAGSARKGQTLPGRPAGPAALTEEELLSQRCRALSQLYRMYKKEYWSLMEELRTRHQQFCAAGGSALKSSGETAMADSDEELSVRELYRRRQRAVGSKPEAAQSAGKATAASGAAKGEGDSGRKARRRKHGRGDNGAAAAAGTAAAAEAAPGHAAGANAGQHDGASSEGSDQECPALSDVEDLILQQDPYGPARDTSALLRGYGGFRSGLPSLGRLEECASAAIGREMDAGAALAALLGPHSRFLIHRTCVILGRGGPANVDIDLAAEGDARKVSRRAASITLRGDGAFRLRCLGRRSVRVNGREVPPGSAAPLPHLSLLEAGRVRLLFAVNPGAVRRVVRRSRAITIRQDG